MREQQASQRDWLLAYSRLYESLPRDAHIACPNCGHDALRVAFVADPGDSSGYAEFWCGNCLFGLWLSRVPIPEGVAVLPIGLSPEDLVKHIPNFKIVRDDGGDDTGDEHR